MRGERLKAERKRLKMTQPAIAELLDVAVGSIVRYEKQGDALNQNQLIKLKNAGFDTHYITFGLRASDLTDAEFQIISAYRSLSDELKVGFVNLANAYAMQNKATH